LVWAKYTFYVALSHLEAAGDVITVWRVLRTTW